MATFVIPGEPKGKGRPRFSARTTKDGRAFVTTRTPQETVIYENLVRLEYEAQCGVRFPDDAQMVALITAVYAIPKSASKRRRAQMLEGRVLPRKKPDVDNIAKCILDSLNGIAYRDDSQVVECTVKKVYGDTPCVMVCMSAGGE